MSALFQMYFYSDHFNRVKERSARHSPPIPQMLFLYTQFDSTNHFGFVVYKPQLSHIDSGL